MASFSSFLNILPDPSIYIADAGESSETNTGATAGPGFASVKFSSSTPTVVSQTNSNRVVSRRIAGQKWEINITYNPMTRDEFEPVYNFLLYHGRLTPFKVRLPQYQTMRDSDWENRVTSNDIRVDGDHLAGSPTLLIDNASSEGNDPRPGDMFTITDTTDSLHTKAYRIVRVETNTNYKGTQPVADERRLWIHPHLTRATANNMVVNFANPEIRVVMGGDLVEYTLNTSNLYKFSLKLVEANA